MTRRAIFHKQFFAAFKALGKCGLPKRCGSYDHRCAYAAKTARHGFHPPHSEADTKLVGEFSDDAAAEQQYAGNENCALNNEHPFADRCKLELHHEDNESADHGPEDGAEATDERHQNDLA